MDHEHDDDHAAPPEDVADDHGHEHGPDCEHDHDHDDHDGHGHGESPLERLRLCLLNVDAERLRAGLRLLGRSQAEAVAKAVGAKAPLLVRASNPVAHLEKAVDRTVLLTVADAVIAPCLDATIDELGEAAEDPTLEQLVAAIDVVEPEHSRPVVVLMLAAVAAMGMPATKVCEELLATERFAPPTAVPEAPALGPAGVAPLVAPTPTEAERAEQAAKREARKARKEQQRAKNRPQSPPPSWKKQKPS